MALTRIKVEQVNGKMEIVDKKTGIIDDNPVVYHGNEDLPITDDDLALGRVKNIGRGFSAFIEHINMKEQPKDEDPKVSISFRLPVSYATKLRATGRGWQTRMSDYLIKGIKQGVFDDMAI